MSNILAQKNPYACDDLLKFCKSQSQEDHVQRKAIWNGISTMDRQNTTTISISESEISNVYEPV